MTISACPDRARLSGYLLGNVSVEELETTAAHLETCATCSTTVAELDRTPDSLVEALRWPVEQSEFRDEPQLGKLLNRLHTLPMGAWEEVVPPAQLLPPGTRIGAYRIEQTLGSGGMGIVYRAWHVQLDRPVALKLLASQRMGRPDAIARFHREMKALGRLVHPHLVTAHDAGECEGVLYLAMEYVEGLDLSQIGGRLGPMSVANACALALQAAEGLEYARRQGVIHRDVKPSNLMLTGEGTVKVLDLGLAKLVDHPGHEELSSNGHFLGTLEYAAPEQVSGGDLDSRADVYGLGATLYKLLTGHNPIANSAHRTVAQKIVAITTELPPHVRNFRPDVPESLARLLDRMMAKDPAVRPATPGELAEPLKAFAAGSDLRAVYRRAVATPEPSGAALAPTNSLSMSVDSDVRRKGRAWKRLALWTASLLALGVAVLCRGTLAPWNTDDRQGCESATPPPEAHSGSVEAADADGAPSPTRLVAVDRREIEAAAPGEIESSPSAPTGGGASPSGPAARPAPAGAASGPDTGKESTVYPVAVLAFEDLAADLKAARQVADLITARLGAQPRVHLVERADLEKVGKELQLNLTGAVSPDDSVRIGRLTGAKILITGSVGQLDKTFLLTAKVIGTESGRVLVASQTGSTADDLASLTGKLADGVVDLFTKRAGELVPKAAPRPDRIAALLRSLGKGKQPSVWVSVAERHVGQPVIDPAAQTELVHICRETGFDVIDVTHGNRKQADVILEGEAFSELAGRHGELVSVKGRVEVKAVDRQTGRVIAAERQTEVAVDLAEQIAGKASLQEAAAAIAERLLPKLRTHRP